MNDTNSLAHTSWNCKYHIVFAPKYRRKVFYGEKRREVGEILRTLCNWKKIKIIEAEVCPDHVHMLVEIPPKVSVSSFMGYLKGKSSLMIYEKYPELKMDQGFMNLQAQLEGTENRIAVARQTFNECAQTYNTFIRKFPNNLVASMFGFERKPYFESQQGADIAPTVEF